MASYLFKAEMRVIVVCQASQGSYRLTRIYVTHLSFLVSADSEGLAIREKEFYCLQSEVSQYI